MTPAEELREAAQLMRERADDLPPPPWHAEGRDVTATQDYDGDNYDPDWDCAFNVAVCRRQDEAEHFASWHPLVADAVARWLEVKAANLRDHDHGYALAVARAYLGSEREAAT